MEDLWRMREMTYRVNDVADQAEYRKMLQRFREQEQRSNLKNLLYGEDSFSKAEPLPKSD